MTPTAENNQPEQPPKIVHEKQPANRRFWVREHHYYYASFDFVVMDGPYEKYTPVAGFNDEQAAEYCALGLEKANQPEQRTIDEAPAARPDLDAAETLSKAVTTPDSRPPTNPENEQYGCVYNEDSYCVACGAGVWKFHAPDCQIADLADKLEEVIAYAHHLEQELQKSQNETTVVRALFKEGLR